MSQFNKHDPFTPKRIGRLHLDGADKLIAQLSFIKRKLRYPIDTQKIIAFIGILLTFPVPIVLWIFFKRNPQHEVPYWVGFIVIMLFVPAMGSLLRFLQTFKFAAVKSQFSNEENAKLLTLFFQSCQIRFHQHPDRPELFWIMSERIVKDMDIREVVIFIVEDRRILINSHFTRPRFISPVGQPHYRQLAKALGQWMDNNRPVSAEILRA